MTNFIIHKNKILAILICCLLQTTLFAKEPRCPAPVPGDCYIDCRRAAAIITGMAIGTLLFAGILAIVISDGRCSHSHSSH